MVIKEHYLILLNVILLLDILARIYIFKAIIVIKMCKYSIDINYRIV